MNWTQKAEMVHNHTLLGQRESEIAVLSQTRSPIEIQQQLAQEHDTELTLSTIRSIKSTLKQKWVKSMMTETLLRKGTQELELPIQSPNEFTSQSLFTHAYIGSTGSGKTVTAQTHAYRLLEQDVVQNVVVVDPFGSWECIKQEYENSVSLIVPENTDSADSVHDELLDAIDVQSASAPTVVFLDHLNSTGVLRESQLDPDTPTAIERIQQAIDSVSGSAQSATDVASNLSIRLIVQQQETLPEAVSADRYYLHPGAVPDSETLPFSDEEAETVLQFLDLMPSHPSEDGVYVVLVDTHSDEEIVRPNVLTEDERRLLTEK